MARHGLLVLVVLLAFTASCAGCTEYQELPVQMYIDTDYSDVERQAIIDAMDQWNEWAGRRYVHGDSVFVYMGQYNDDYNVVGDFEDGRHVIYRINDRSNPDEQYLQEIYKNNHGVGAYSPMSDMFLVMYPIDEHLVRLEAQLREEIENGEREPMNVDEYIRNRRYGMVQSFAIHELGHMLGLIHYNNRVGVMNSAGPNIYQGVEYLSDADLDAFCLIYDCCCDRSG